jgi:hypothetical protein
VAAAKLLLKARPTAAQLGDRLRPVDGQWPDGVELYLAAADLASTAGLAAIVERLRQAEVPPGFVWLIEGPVDSLDGGDFDVTRDSPADLQVLERLADLAAAIGAKAVNIHVIAPNPNPAELTVARRAELLDRAVPFLARFVELMQAAGTVPTVENMPPVLRMRRSDFSFTAIGMASADLRWLVAHLPALRLLPDTSHAGLYLNARHTPPDPRYPWAAPLRAYLDQLPPEPFGLVDFMASFGPAVENAQISNATGILGEGLPYGEGDYVLDPAIRWLSTHTRHIVTETLEANNDDAVQMRDALRRMRAALA